MKLSSLCSHSQQSSPSCPPSTDRKTSPLDGSGKLGLVRLGQVAYIWSCQVRQGEATFGLVASCQTCSPLHAPYTFPLLSLLFLPPSHFLHYSRLVGPCEPRNQLSQHPRLHLYVRVNYATYATDNPTHPRTLCCYNALACLLSLVRHLPQCKQTFSPQQKCTFSHLATKPKKSMFRIGFSFY